MNCETPKRISLRRKRLNNEVEHGNQAKRKSPSHPTPNKETLLNEIQKKMPHASLQTPKRCPREGKKETSANTPICSKDLCQTPHPQLSPTSPFNLSQMPSTQDCEVIWDCNSPGYSKEDLKRMFNKSGDKSFTPSPIVPILNQLPFDRFRPPHIQLANRKAPNTSTIVAAALDNLLTKVNEEYLKRMEFDHSSEDETSHDCLNSNFLKASQPFNVSGIEPNVSFSEAELGGVSSFDVQEVVSSQTAKPGQATYKGNADGKTISPNKNIAIHHSQIAVIGSTNTTPDTTSTGVSKLEGPPRTGSNDFAMDVSFSAMDDDDLFSESFLKATQVMEDALFNEETGKFNTPSVLKNENLAVSPLSRICKKKPVVLFPISEKETVACFSVDEEESPKSWKDSQLWKEEDPVTPSLVIGKDRKLPLVRKRKTESGFHIVKEANDNEASKSNLMVHRPQPVTSNGKDANETDCKLILNKIGLRASFQLEGFTGCTQVREKAPPAYISFLSEKVQSGEDRTLNHPDEVGSKFDAQQLHPQKPEQKKPTSISSCISNIKTSLANPPTTKIWNDIRTNAATRQRVPLSKWEATNSSSAAPLLSHPLKASPENFMQELEDDEDDFAAMMPSLVEAEAEYTQCNPSQCNRSVNKSDQTRTVNTSKPPSTSGEGYSSTNPPPKSKGTTNSENFACDGFINKTKRVSRSSYKLNSIKSSFETNPENGLCGPKVSASVSKEVVSKNSKPDNWDCDTINWGFTSTSSKSCNQRKSYNSKNSIFHEKNSVSHKSNFSGPFKRPLFASISSNSNKTIDESDQNRMNEVLLGTSNEFPEEEKCVPVTGRETSSSLSNSSSKIHEKLPQDDHGFEDDDHGFEDDDHLFLQDDVLQSISRAESQYMASLTQRKGFVEAGSKMPSPSSFPKSTSDFFRTSNNPQESGPAKDLKLSSIANGANLQAIAYSSEGISGRSGNEARAKFSPTVVRPSPWTAAKTHSSRYTPKKEQIPPSRETEGINSSTERLLKPTNYRQTLEKGGDIHSQKTPVEEERISDEDLLNLAFDENPFEEAFIDESLVHVAQSCLPSPDFGKPFKPPSFTGSRVGANSNCSTMTLSHQKAEQSVNKFPGRSPTLAFSSTSRVPNLRTNPIVDRLPSGPAIKVSARKSNLFTNCMGNKYRSRATLNKSSNILSKPTPLGPCLK